MSIEHLIEETLTKTIREDLQHIEDGINDSNLSSKKLLLLHLFVQLYKSESPPAKQLSNDHELDAIIQQIDALQQKTDAYIIEFDQKNSITDGSH